MVSYADVVAHASWVWKSSASNEAMRAVLTKGYPNIGPQICARCSAEGIGFAQAMFLFAQAFIEQSATVGNPAPTWYRIFNMQLHKHELATFSAEALAKMEKMPVPVSGVPGAYIRKLPSDEKLKGKTQSRTSPFFAFDAMKTSVNHFLRRLSGDAQYFLVTTTPEMMALMAGYAAAFKALKEPKSGVDDYTRKLQAAGYASAGQQYITDIHNRYRTVTGDFIKMIEANQPTYSKDFLEWDPSQGATHGYGAVLTAMKAQAEAALKATPQTG